MNITSDLRMTLVFFGLSVLRSFGLSAPVEPKPPSPSSLSTCAHILHVFSSVQHLKELTCAAEDNYMTVSSWNDFLKTFCFRLAVGVSKFSKKKKNWETLSGRRWAVGLQYNQADVCTSLFFASKKKKKKNRVCKICFPLYQVSFAIRSKQKKVDRKKPIFGGVSAMLRIPFTLFGVKLECKLATHTGLPCLKFAYHLFAADEKASDA